MTTRYLIVPGWAGSGPAHWQSHWERELVGAVRVEMPDWLAPRRADWLGTLDRAIERTLRVTAQPPILIGHSLGCIVIAQWAALGARPIAAALLVAPADLDRERCPPFLREFAPVPRARLPFRSHVVASDDDPYASLARSEQIARDWGSSLTVLGGAGHINADSGHGPWPDGKLLLERLVGHLDRDERDEPGDEADAPAYRGDDGDDSPWICRGVD